jgi:uroporphyrinogen-III synthase
MTVVVRGPKPAAVLGGRGVRIDLSAKEPATTREVLEALDGVALRKKRVLVQRYGVANIELEETLKSRGAEVVEITTYRWALPADTRPLIDLVDAVERGAIDAVAITNAAQVYNLFALAERQGRTVSLRGALNRTLVGSIGPVTSGALMKFGVAVGVEASPPRLGQLLDALERALAGA